MKRFADSLHRQLIWNLRDYGYFEVINIYEDGWGIYVHVMIEGAPYTVAYDLNESGVPPFIWVCMKEGFYRNRKDLLMIERVTRYDILRLKEKFHQQALRNVQEATAYGNFEHLTYQLEECGGFYAAKMMIDEAVSMEFHHLAFYGRLDLTLEHLVLDNKYELLFTDRERDVCRRRLHQYGDDQGYSFMLEPTLYRAY